MTPQQQIQLGCRQLVEQTVKLRGWVDVNSGDLQGLSAGLASELRDIERRAGQISRASLGEPAFAIAGSQEQSRREIISAVTGHAGKELLLESSDGKNRFDLSCLLPAPHAMASAVRIGGRTVRQTRDGLAYPARLLDRIDIVKILARAHMMGPNPTQGAARQVKTLLQTIDVARQGLSAYRVPGFSEPDIHDLIEYLHALCPQGVAFGNLTAAGYWDAILELLPHLDDQSRIPLLAGLWGCNETMTRIYMKSSDALEKLGNGQAMMLGHDALFAPDNAARQNNTHPRSVLDRRTFEGILEPIADMIDVSASYGAPQRVSRAVLSLLLRDIRLERADVQWTSADAYDTVIFPHPGTIPGKMLCAPVVRAIEHEANLALLQLLGHVKARYVFEQAIECHEINSLVVCCATPDQIADDCLTEPVADWIGLTQGVEPHIREQARTSLFIATQQSGITSTTPASPNWQYEVAAGQDWPLNWYPGRPFDNIIALDGADDSFRNRSGSSAPADISMPGSLSTLPVGEFKLNGPRCSQTDFGHPARGPVHTALKTRQLQRNLNDMRRGLRSRFLRFFVSDQQSVPEWRRQMANVAQSRLALCAQQKRLCALLQALSSREPDIELVLNTALDKRTAAFDANETSNWQTASGGERLYDADCAQDLASIVVNWWAAGMRRAARSHAFTRRIRLSSQVLLHIVDELVIASERIGMRAQLTSRIQAIICLQPTPAELALRAAAQSARFIAVFLETLQAPDPLADAAQRVLGSASYSNERDQSHQHWLRRGVTSSATLSDQWPKAFALLVEDNLAAVQSVARGGERERALHQLLNELNASAIEADL